MTGMVTLPAADWNTSCPVNVPAIKPPFGNELTDMPTVSVAGAVPFGADIFNQLPVSDVLCARFQNRVPDPALRMRTFCVVGLPPPACMKKVICPGKLSKAVLPAAVTVRVTGTVIDILPP